MNFLAHHTLWAEADLEFFDLVDHTKPRFAKHYADKPQGHPVRRYHQAAFADTYQCHRLTVFDPDWTEQAHYTDRVTQYSQPITGHFRHVRTPHGHNWFGVTRIDFTLFPPTVPYYFSGHLFTGGMASTFKLRRLTTIHQVTHLIPAKATFTPLKHGVWLARYLIKRKPAQSFLIRSTRGWLAEPTFHQAITRAVATRLIPAA